MDDIAIVIGCLDLYEPLWKPMCYSLSKYFSDSTWPIFWITNSKKAPCGTTIRVGGDHTHWSDRMMRGLKQIKSSVIFWMVSDHWVSGYPDMDAIKDFAKLVKNKKILRCRLYPGWDHDKSKGVCQYDSRLLVFTEKSPYRCSCKPSFWRREVLLDLLCPNEMPWDFERRGTGRSKKYGDSFVAVRDWGFWPIVTRGDPTGPWDKSPCVKGKLTTAAKRFYEREGLKFDLKHPVKSNPFGKEKPTWILPG